MAAGNWPQMESDNRSVTPPPLRSDLIATTQRYLGRDFVIFKNPISLAFFRLPAAHGEAAQMFDGKTRVAELAPRLCLSSKYWRALTSEQAAEELSALAMQLAHAGLLQVRGSTATERGRRLRELKSSRAFEAAVGQVLFFRKSLYDPNRLLQRLLNWFQWLYRPGVLLSGLFFVLVTLLAALWNIGSIAEQGANFFTLSNLGLTWLLFVLIKVLHEFGHGVTAKHFGAEVHEMGFMFILFAPYLFCNVSDVWRAGKWARLATGAAGLAVELMLAAAAFWLWLATQPGLFNQMCFNTMVVCSVSTLFFNGNPLMKFDGYYILADAMEIPNLRAKSNAWVTGWAQRHLLGIEPPAAAAPHEASPLFGFYAVAAYLYGWFIIFSISAMVFDLLKPYGLEFLSRTYVGLFLFVSVALPLYRLGRSVRRTPGLRSAVAVRSRLAAAGALLLLAALLLVPWTEQVKRSAVLEHSVVARVVASAPGMLGAVHVSEGEQVVAGQLLAKLDSPDLDTHLVSLRLDREALQVRLRAMASQDSPEARLALPVVARQIRELDEEIAGAARKVGSLGLRSPQDGVVRTRRPAELAGRYFPAGATVLEIGGSGAPRLIIALDEQQARKVRPGQQVRAVFAGLSGRIFRGVVTRAPVSPARQMSAPSLANLLGGDVPSEPDTQGQALLPSVQYFEAEAELEIAPEQLALLRAQSSGRASIEVRRSSMASWMRDRFYDLLSPNVRL